VNSLLGENINYCKRANQILFKGRYVKYPFENDLGALDRQDAYECLIDYLKNDFRGEPTNFEEWAYSTFGRSIADKYLIPYNRKIWKMEPREMGLEWVGRVPKPPMEDVVKSALGIETEGYTHQLYFRYPLHGGFEALVRAMTKDPAKVACNTRVEKIRKVRGRWVVYDGQRERVYDHLVLAFPVMDALGCFEGVPAEVTAAVQGLR
jgi:protoporphyrinogen oxidase